jgi:hypothetical protein
MIELKNKEGEVGCLHKYEDIKDIRKEKIIENFGDVTASIKAKTGMFVEFNDGSRIECFNTMEDIQAQIRAIKGVIQYEPKQMSAVDLRALELWFR